MTREDFRALALAFPGAEEKSHHGQADYRLNNRIFATGGGTSGRPVVKLLPEEQEMLIAAEPDVLSPSAGAWGRHGWTHVDLERADDALVRDLLRRSHANVTAKPRRRGG